MGPAKQITTLMEGEKYTTLSSYIPMIYGLENVWNYDDNASENENNLAGKYRSSIQNRFGETKNNVTLILSMMVDPRFKDRFLDQYDKEYAYNILLQR